MRQLYEYKWKDQDLNRRELLTEVAPARKLEIERLTDLIEKAQLEIAEKEAQLDECIKTIKLDWLLN